MRLRVSAVQITQMLGITSKSPIDLEQLDVDLIVLHGGQGAGKSTVARAITHALWPEKGLTAWGAVSFKLGQPAESESNSTATFIADRVEFPNRPNLSGLEELGRAAHWIRLHDLLPETPVNEEAFANHILRLADGGVNLEAAVQEVKKLPQDKVRSTGKIAANLRSVENDLKTADKDQSDVFADEQRLERLESEAKQLRHIQKRLSALESLKKWRDGVSEQYSMRTEVKKRFDLGFPEARDDTREQLGKNARAIDKTKNDTQQKQDDLDEAEKNCQELAFKSAPPDDAGMDELDERVIELKQASDDLKRAHEEVTKAHDAAKRAAVIFDSHAVAPNDLMPAAKNLDAFGDFLRQAAALRHARTIHDVLANKLPHNHAGSNTEDELPAENLLEAYLKLSQWLHTSPTPARFTENTTHRGMLHIILLTVAAAVLAGFAALTRSWWSLGFVGLGALSWILYFVFRSKEVPSQAVTKSPPSEVLKSLRVELPSSWNSEDCQRRRQELHDAYADRIRADSLQPVNEACRMAEARLNEADAELTKQRHALQALGCKVDAIETRPDPSGALRQSILAVSELQEHLAKTELAERTANDGMVDALAELTAELTAALGDLDTDEQPRDAHEARTAVKRLRTRKDNWKKFDAQVSQASEALEGLSTKLNEEQAARATLLGHLNLQPDVISRDENRQLDVLDEWFEAKQKLDGLDIAVATLEKSAGENELTEAENELSDDALNDAIVEATNAGEQLETLDTTIGGIRKSIENLSNSNTTAKLLTERDQCATTLRGKRHAAEYLAVIDAVVSHLRQSSDARRPRVLERADEILRRVSSGELALTSLPEDKLVVGDANGNQRPIGRLSDGERVQVALAVRLAFVQETDQSVQCPVIIDEALANTDDDRAPRIIDAILDVATRGWQVIYLTSQGDEVAKWKERIEAQDASQQTAQLNFAWKPIDLDDVRQLTTRTAIPSQAAWSPISLAPPLEEEALDAYALRIGRRGLDHWLAAGLQNPRWLANTPQELHALAQRRAGRIDFLLERADTEDDLLVMSQRRYGLLQSVFELCRRGRGQPVPRDAPLTDISGIGTSLEGRLFAALEKCHYEADSLLFQIGQDDGAISGLGPAAKEALRSWLEENDYLGDPDRKLSREQVLGQLEGGCDPEDRDWLVRIIGVIPD